MLSWSGHEQDVEVDLASMEVGLPHAEQLRAFATAATSPALDADELATTRAALLAAVGEAATVDAAAVVANFEMMTRLADCTGAVLDNPMSIAAGKVTGADGFASRH
ncbi:MAG: hypothetical protein RLZZ305_1906 [Actinomycetota bacterium]|jgi:hypothetical protein